MQVPFKLYLHGCRRIAPWLVLPRILLFLDTLRPRDIDGSEGVAALGFGFCARSLHSCRKLHWSPCEHLAFCFPLIANSFSESYNPILTERIDIREDANSHKVDLVQEPFKKFLHGRRLDFPDGLLPLRHLLLDALLPLLCLWLRGRKRFLVWGFARSYPSYRNLHWSPLEHPFAFHWLQTPFPLSTPLNPLRLVTTAAV